MERKKAVTTLLCVVFFTTLAIAAGPQTINYQGYLKNSDGTPVSTATSIRFALYSSNPARNNPVWSDSHTVTPVNGIYGVRLGSRNPITAPFDVPYYLGVQIEGDAEMALQPLSSTPYAMRAAVADTIAGGTQTILTGGAANNGLVVQGAVGQSADLQLWKDETGANVASLAPSGDLNLAGNLSLPVTTPGNGIIKAGGTWFIHNFGSANFFAGLYAGNLTMTGHDNTATGSSALYANTTGRANTASGSNALYSNTDGYENAGFGAYSLMNNTTGYRNTASGKGALQSNTIGTNNTAFGESALAANIATGGNVAVGARALGRHNISPSPAVTPYDTFNTAVGYGAMYNNNPDDTANGSYNTALGYNAGFNNGNGTNNTLIGANANAGGTGLITNATAIGANAMVGQSNSLVLGANGVNVGIGTTTPTERLDVIGTVKATAFSGSGSGLSDIDAAKLGGAPASSYATSAHTHAGSQITSAVANASNATYAVDADTVDNKHAADFVDTTSAQTIGGAKTFTGKASMANDGLSVGTNQLVVNGGKTGIGTATPNKALDVAGDMRLQLGQFLYLANGIVASGQFSPRCSCDRDIWAQECTSRNYSAADLGLNCYDVYDSGGYTDEETGEYFPSWVSQPFIKGVSAPLFEAGAYGGIGINKANPLYDLDVNGTVQATKFIGDGTGLSNVNVATATGVVGSTHGGTGLATQPTAAGQYLRSIGAGRWGIGSIQAADLPSLSGSYMDLTSAQTIGGSKTFSDQTYFNSPIRLPRAFEVLANDMWDTTTLIRSDDNGGIFMGTNAGQNTNAFGNSAFGNFALLLNYSGTGNTAVGSGSLYNSKENYNTAIGYNALGVLSYGSSNIAVGYNAGSNVGVGSGNIYIGNSGVYTSENNTMRLGGSSTASTYVGGVYGKTASSGIPVIVNSSGQLGTTTSSRRFKEDIREMGDSSDGLMKLRPVTFHYKPEYSDGPRTLQYGLIAEEVAEVYPELVNYDEKGEVNTVYYHFVNAMLLNEVQKQHHQLVELQSTIEQLRAKTAGIDELKAELAELKRLISR